MSDKVLFTASPFVISKSILKHPIRDPNSRFHIQTKQRNLHLFITKKHSELQSLFGLSSRNHAIAYVTKKLSERAGGKTSNKDTEPKKEDEDSDPYGRKAAQSEQEEEMEEMVEKKKMKKRAKTVTREQKIRAHVNRCMNSEIVDTLYQKYKDKQREYELIRLRDSGSVDVNKIVNAPLEEVEQFEDFFLVHALRAQGLNAATLLDVPELKVNEVDVEPPQDEIKALDKIIEDHNKRSNPVLTPEQIERREVIKQYRNSSLATLNCDNIQFRRHKQHVDQFEDPYEVQEKLMRESREQKLKDTMSRFTRNDEESVVKKIEEKAKLYLSKTCRIEQSPNRSRSSFNPYSSASFIRGDMTYNENSPSPNRTVNDENFPSPTRTVKDKSASLRGSPVRCISVLSTRSRPDSRSIKKFVPKIAISTVTRSQSVPKNAPAEPMTASIAVDNVEDLDNQLQSVDASPAMQVIGAKFPINIRSMQDDVSKNSTWRGSTAIEETRRHRSSTKTPLTHRDKLLMNRTSSNRSFFEQSNSSFNVTKNFLIQDSAMTKTGFYNSFAKSTTSMQNMKASPEKQPVTNSKNQSLVEQIQEVYQEFKDRAEEVNKDYTKQIKKVNQRIKQERKETDIDARLKKDLSEIHGNEAQIFANKWKFKREVVNKMVSCIENKEQALGAIQKKKYIDEMALKVV